jgi:hypothetical protein
MEYFMNFILKNNFDSTFWQIFNDDISAFRYYDKYITFSDAILFNRKISQNVYFSPIFSIFRFL